MCGMGRPRNGIKRLTNLDLMIIRQTNLRRFHRQVFRPQRIFYDDYLENYC